MRRALMSLFLCGCFGESDTIDKTASSTAASTTIEPEESSSSEGESSSSGAEESSSSGEAVDPRACPEWCTGTCDGLVGFERCRCTNDAICSLGGLTCHGEENGVGHCY